MPVNHIDGPDGNKKIGKMAIEKTRTTANTGRLNSFDSHTSNGIITCIYQPQVGEPMLHSSCYWIHLMLLLSQFQGDKMFSMI